MLTGKYRFIPAACGAMVLEVETTEGLFGHWTQATEDDARELFGDVVEADNGTPT